MPAATLPMTGDSDSQFSASLQYLRVVLCASLSSPFVVPLAQPESPPASRSLVLQVVQAFLMAAGDVFEPANRVMHLLEVGGDLRETPFVGVLHAGQDLQLLRDVFQPFVDGHFWLFPFLCSAVMIRIRLSRFCSIIAMRVFAAST